MTGRGARVLLGGVLAVAAVLGPAVADGATGGPRVWVNDNAYNRAGHDRPTVTVGRGTTVTWRWNSRQSHSVTVHSGPQRFRSKVRRSGEFSERLTRPGTYRIVCEIHAPGMKMTVVVK